MPAITVKVTSKNQLTLPKRIMAQLDYPSHFELTVSQGALCLFPGRVVSLNLQARTAGIPPDVLRLATRMVAERKGLKPKPPAPAEEKEAGG